MAALPVSPDVELAWLAAPLLAKLSAVPAAWVSPVLSESPELPDPSLFTSMIARPLIAVLTAPRVAFTSPLLPVSPESPLSATGLAQPVELAPPVFPVLVAEDCAVDAPELPDRASGSWVDLTSPPSPPSADVFAIESPPVTLPTLAAEWPPTRTRLLASPPRPEVARARSPPLPASPPMRVALTVLWALPVVPETDAQGARRNSAGDVVAPVQSQAGSVNFRRGTGTLNWWTDDRFAESAFWIHS